MPRTRDDSNKTCRNCLFWEQDSRGGPNTGLCRRGSPIGNDSYDGTADWPRTYSGDWCGEYRRGVEAKEPDLEP